MEQIKLQNNEEIIVTISDKESTEQRNEERGYSYYRWIFLHKGVEKSFNATTLLQGNLLNFKQGDDVRILKKYDSSTNKSRFVVEKVTDAKDNFSSIKSYLPKENKYQGRDFVAENTGKCLNTLLCASISAGEKITESKFYDLLDLAKSNMELKWIERNPIDDIDLPI